MGIPKKIRHKIDTLVNEYKNKDKTFLSFAEQVHMRLNIDYDLRPYIHSIKYRIKNAEHLRNKLARKAEEAISKGKPFAITKKGS